MRDLLVSSFSLRRHVNGRGAGFTICLKHGCFWYGSDGLGGSGPGESGRTSSGELTDG
jgi:hypothetical protein